jgi:hypothetical protein
MEFNLFVDERVVQVYELFDSLKKQRANEITYLKVCESPVTSKSIKFISFSTDIKEIIRNHLTEAGYYSYYEIWKNI